MARTKLRAQKHAEGEHPLHSKKTSKKSVKSVKSMKSVKKSVKTMKHQHDKAAKEVKTAVEEKEKKEKRPHRFRPGTVALREIRKYQKTGDLLAPRLPIIRLVREIMQEVRPGQDFRLQGSACELLHMAVEEFITDIMTAGVLGTVIHKRQQLMPRDIELALRTNPNWQQLIYDWRRKQRLAHEGAPEVSNEALIRDARALSLQLKKHEDVVPKEKKAKKTKKTTPEAAADAAEDPTEAKAMEEVAAPESIEPASAAAAAVAEPVAAESADEPVAEPVPAPAASAAPATNGTKHAKKTKKTKHAPAAAAVVSEVAAGAPAAPGYYEL